MYNLNRNHYDLNGGFIMKIAFTKMVGILTISSMLVLVGCQTSGSSKKQEQTSESHTHENEHDHSHDHSHAHDESTEKFMKGISKTTK